MVNVFHINIFLCESDDDDVMMHTKQYLSPHDEWINGLAVTDVLLNNDTLMTRNCRSFQSVGRQRIFLSVKTVSERYNYITSNDRAPVVTSIC